jgi:hypothetical protein
MDVNDDFELILFFLVVIIIICKERGRVRVDIQALSAKSLRLGFREAQMHLVFDGYYLFRD